MDHLQLANSSCQPFAVFPKMRRILHVINGEHYAGAERVQDLLAQRLPDCGYEVGWVCVKPEVFPHQRRSQATPLHSAMMRTKFDLRAARKIAQIAREGDYHLLHAHTARSLLLTCVAARLAGKPFVYHVHSPASHDSTRVFANRVNMALERVCLTGVSKLICVSQSLVDHMKTLGYRPGLITLVPNGVPVQPTLFQRDSPCGVWKLGTVALFRPRKGIEVLLQSLAQLRDQGYDVCLRAVGAFETPGYRRQVLALTERLGIADLVQWRGFCSDVLGELQQMDVMVLPSLFGEGLPLVMLEAMSVGVPVVGTEVQGIPEVLTPGTGLIARPGCVASLAQCLEQVLRGEVDWMSLRRNAWRRQCDRYSDRSMAAQVADVYRDVLDKTRPCRGR